MDEIHLNEEDVVFDEVVNEVSIIDDEQNRNQNLITLQTSSNSNDNVNQFIQQTIKSPVSNTGQVTSIRNVTPNTKTTPNKVVNNIVLTPKNAAQLKKPTSANKNLTISQNKQTTINLSPTQPIQLNSNNQQQILTKVFMTSGGQQLLITSPVKQQTTSNNQEKQQLIGIVPVSPKQTSTITNKTTTTTTTTTNSSTNISIRSKSSTSTASNLTIQSPTNQTASVDKPQQYQIIRLVSATNNSNTPTNSTITTANLKQITTASGQQKILIPTSNIKGLTNQATASGQQFLMYTAPQLIQSTTQQQQQKQVTFSPATSNQRQTFVPILPNPSTGKANKQNGSSNKANSTQLDDSINQSNTNLNASASSNRPRKPCNCTRSQCLKLYCDCFANGEFCSNCNCINCFNNLDHEENRQKAIKQCLERNPHAFHPKIGKGKTTAQEGIERRHTKGCNCRRSGCLKNYCECYEAKILCTDLCKCCACKNYEDSYERKSLMHLVDAVDIRSLHGTTSSNFAGKENDPSWSNEFRPKLPVPLISDRLLSCSFITNDLVDAATKCLIAQAEKSQKLALDEEETEKLILEEFGNCLSSIIQANKEKQEK